MKNNLWFKHDYGARNDPKLKRLVSKKGPGAGYVWWVIIEMLNEEGGTLPRDYYKEIAYDTHSKTEIVRYVVEESGLFQYNDTDFWSNRQRRDQNETEYLKEQKRKAGLKSGERRRSNKGLNKQESETCLTNAEQMLNTCSTDAEPNTHTHIRTNTHIENIDADASSPDASVGGELFSDEKQGKVTATQFVEVWNRVVEDTGAAIRTVDVRALGDKPREKIQTRIREMSRIGPPLDVLESVMRRACASKFCCGATKSGWLMKFDWFIRNGENWRKVYQGDYDDNKPNGAAGGYDRLRVNVTSPEDYEGDF